MTVLPEGHLARFSRKIEGDELRPSIVVVPPRGDLRAGFELARTLLAQGQSVHLVGHGATLEDTWPAWVRDARLPLTELGAYLDRPLPHETVKERQDLRRWLDSVFGTIAEGLSGSDVFYGSAAQRLFQPVLDAAPFVRGLLRAHPQAQFHCTDSHWAGASMLGLPAEVKTSLPRRAAFAVRLAAGTTAATLGSAFIQAKEWTKSSMPRRLLREMRAHPRPSPQVWVGLVSDWPRFNRHLLDGVVFPTRETGRSIGVLLLATVLAGTRNEADLSERQGPTLWPGLGALADEISTLAIDQLVAPVDWWPALQVMLRSAVSSCAVAFKTISEGPSVQMGAAQFDLSPHLWELAKLLTIDVQRAIAAARATRSFTESCSVEGRCVILSAGSLAPFSAADLMLQRAGATTVEVYHGAGMEGWIGGQESRSSWRALFTEADAETVGALGQKAVVGGMPLRQVRRGARRAGPPRVLFLSNYCHRDYATNGLFAFECFQNELLSVSGDLTRSFAEIELRWRPHPADNADAVTRSLHRFPWLERSPHPSLEADLEWADIVVSSMSTTVLEALFVDVPVFIHIPPEYRMGPNARRYAPERVFFYHEEGSAKVGPAVNSVAKGDAVDTSIERRTRTAFFGPTGLPESLISALQAAGLAI